MSGERVSRPALPMSKRETKDRPAFPLEIAGRDFEEMVSIAAERIAEHLDGLPEQPMHRSAGGKKIARSLKEGIPERGMKFQRVMRRLFGRVLRPGLNTASGGYLAYIPGGGLPHAAIADLITSAINRYVGVWIAAPGLAQIEANVVAWLAEIAGLPSSTAGGVLTTGGSMANLIAIVTARRTRLSEDFSKGVLYASDQTHHSVKKAAVLAGFPERRVRELPTDATLRLDPRLLAKSIEDDRAAGLEPFMVVGNAGTTNTGTVDDLEGLADVAEREGLWFHVDGAYGGFFRLTERGRAKLRGMERADSVTLDPHKGLFLPYGTGSLVVRDVAMLRKAHAMTASYLPPMQTEADLLDFCELSPELSREARGVRVWLPFKMHGVGAFRDALDEKLDLARQAADEVALMDDVEIIDGPELSLFAFRLVPQVLRGDSEGLDALNRTILSGVNARQRVHITGAVVGGKFVLRVCVLSFRTHSENIEALLTDLRESIADAMRGSSPGTS